MSDAAKKANDAGLAPRHPEDAGELGYRVLNPNAPLNEPRQFEALDPQFQASAEKILFELIERWSKE